MVVVAEVYAAVATLLALAVYWGAGANYSLTRPERARLALWGVVWPAYVAALLVALVRAVREEWHARRLARQRQAAAGGAARLRSAAFGAEEGKGENHEV